MNPDQNLQLSPGETPQQYQTRVAQYQGANKTAQPPGDVSGGMDMLNFKGLLSGVEQKLQYNNSLASQRQLIMKHLFDSPLTPDEAQKLPADVQQVLQSGDRNAAELQLRVINDNLQGRSQSLAGAIQYLTTGYQTAVTQAETQKKDVQTFINNFAKTNFSGPNGQVNVSALKDYLHAAYGTKQYDGLADALGEGGGTPASGDPITSAMEHIAQVESQDNYSAISPVIPSGVHTGEHSYGKYQVLESNIGPWTKEALGTAMTPPEFLNSPQAQDAVAKHEIGKLWNQYGNIQDVASVWFSGVPAAQSKGMKDLATGTTAEDYINKVGNGFNASTTPSTPSVNPNVKAWADQILAGSVSSVTSVPVGLRTQVVKYLDSLDSNSYPPLAARRFTMAANAIVTNYINLPGYSLTANGLPYLERIDAAMKNPGSVADQDLLDSLTKLNSSGNAISDAQVRIITDGKSFSDWAGVLKNRLGTGGVLSDSQRQQIFKIAHSVYDNYKKGYQPVYDAATKQLKDAGIPKPFWTIPDLNTLSSLSGVDGTSGSSPSGGSTYNGITLPN